MGRWYRDNQRLFREQKETLHLRHPTLNLDVLNEGYRINDYVHLKKEAAVVQGNYILKVPETPRSYDYRIALIMDDTYFKQPPVMYCNDPKLPVGNIDRHILSNGQACLGVHADVAQRWRSRPQIATFLDEVVAPFLTWQLYSDAYGQAPPWGQRPHDKQGILEFYGELLGIPTTGNVAAFMELLARKNRPQGHETCPCGLGQRLRNCHGDVVRMARERVTWKDVELDPILLKRSSDHLAKGAS